jgi:hypothetical protein
MILLAENFYGLTTALASTKFMEWVGGTTISVSASRFPANSSAALIGSTNIVSNGYLSYAIPSSSAIYSGMAVSFQELGAGDSFKLFEFRHTGTIQVRLIPNLSELKVVHGNGTVLGTYNIPGFIRNNWYYIEMGAVISNTSGSCEVRINGNTVISASNVDTQNTSLPIITDIFIGRTTITGGANYGYISASDWYICNSEGSNPRTNTFLGEIRIASLIATQSGDQVDFKPLSASLNSALMLDDANRPDGDATYVSASAVDSMDLYKMIGYTGSVTNIYGVGINTYTRKNDAGERKLALAIKSGSTISYSPSQSITYTYGWNGHVFETNPNTSTNWGSLQDVLNSQVGFKIVK